MDNLDKLTMHEAPKKDEPEELYKPSDKEKKAIKLVYNKFEEYKKYRQKYDHTWLENYEFFRGKQWQNARPSYRHSEVINLIFQDIQSVVPILTDTKPKISFLPVEPGDRALADIIEKVYDYEWRSNKWQDVLTEILYDSHIYGIGYGKVCHEIKNGMGSATFESVDPFHCYPDPDSWDVNKRGRGFIIAEPIRLATARAKYPKYKNYLKADVQDVTGNDKTILGKVKFQSPTDRKDPSYETDDPKHIEDEKMCLDITYYCKDDSYSEKKKKNDDGSEEYEQVLDYPKGRVIHICGGVLIKDEANEYDDYVDRFAPLARLQNYILSREFYGISEIEQLKSPQKIFNKLTSFALDVLTIMGNPIWVVDDTAGVDIDNLFNRPGLIVEKTPGTEVRRESGVQLQPYVLQLIDRMQGWFNEISGSTDITRGQKPEGVTAAKAIMAIQDASHTRLRLKSRLLEGFLQDIGQMYISRMFQFYTVPKVYRITNNQEVTQYFKMSVEPQEDGSKKFVVTEIAEREGEKPVMGEQKEYTSQAKFDIMPSMGSALPFAKAEKIDIAQKFFQLGVIDAEELLSAADYPNKEKILQRMQEMQAQQAQMQQEMMQQQEMAKAQAKAPQQQPQ